MSAIVEALRGHLITGEWTLASGGIASHYIDARPVTYSMPDECVKPLLRIAEKMPRATLVAGPGYGAAPLVMAMSRAMGIPAFLIREWAKPHGVSSEFAGVLPLQYDSVLLVDDVISTGASLLRAARLVRATGATVVGAVVLVSRCDGVGLEATGHGDPELRIGAAIQFGELQLSSSSDRASV